MSQLVTAIRKPGRRELVALGTVVLAVLIGHLLVPTVSPPLAVYGRYASYLVIFSVWMAWFVDWMASRLDDKTGPTTGDGDP